MSFTVTPGRPVDEQAIREYLVGEVREKVDAKTIFEHDDLDKNIRPVAGEKWKLAKEVFNLRDVLGSHDNPLGHACVYVHSETDCKVQLWVTVMGAGTQVNVNGKPVYTEPQCVFGQKKEVKGVELKKGWNTLLMGVTQANWWAFSVCIRNEQGDGLPTGLRYTAELPKEN
jgi:hypothetical protein